jgi:tetratricopeptide (TPR) repeat protein
MRERRLASRRHLCLRVAALCALVFLPCGYPLGAQVASPASNAQRPAQGKLLDSARAMIDRSFPPGDIAGLRSAAALLERALAVAPNDPWLTHYLGFAVYREATLTMGRQAGDPGPLLARADSILDSDSHLAQIAETHALRSSILGMMIGLNPIRGMMLGPQSGAQMERALELGPNNPRVWLMRGIGAINTPPAYGGGLDKAEQYLKKSIELYASDKPQPPAPTWGANEAHIWLGQVYARQKKTDAARAEYQAALAIEPNDMWTRRTLLPALDKTQ